MIAPMIHEDNDGMEEPPRRESGPSNARPSPEGLSARPSPEKSTSTSPPKENKTDALLRGWSDQYRRPVTLTELEEINHNLAHFFSLLLSWEGQLKQKGLIQADAPLDAQV